MGKNFGVFNSIFRYVKQYQFPILWVAITITFLTGFAGFYQKYANDNVNLFSILFATFQLFILEGSVVPDEPVILSFVRLLAPLLLGFTAWETFAVLFADQIRMMKLPLLRDHIVICGLGERGYHMVISCGYSVKKRTIVVIEPDAENDYIPSCKQMGVLVLNGNANEPSILSKAKIAQAEAVYIVTGDDGLNMAIGMQIQSLISNSKTKREEPLRCYVTISDLFYAETASNHKRSLSNKLISMNVLRPNAIGARSLFNTHAIDGKGIDDKSTIGVHLVVAGFGCMGEDVAMQAARIGHFANGKKIKITIVDVVAEEKLAVFLRMFPGLSRCADWEALNYNIEKAELMEWLEKLDKCESLLHIAICINDPAHAVRTALQLDHIFPDGDVPIYVRMENFEHSGAFLKFNVLMKEQKNLHPFGLFSEVYIDAIVNNKGCDKIAKSIYATTMQNTSSGKETEKDAISWELLDHEIRQSNRHQADHLFVKMRAIGYRIEPINTAMEEKRITDFNDYEINLLAEMEHNRWCAELFIRDWSFGENEDYSRRTSSSLTSFANATEEVKRFNCRKIIIIPEVLERAGLWIYRN